MYPKISIVTPNYNLGDFLERTIVSVLTQNYPNLEYIIIDGGSTDNSLEIIEKYNSKLSYCISEKDNGLYHALNKGFAKSTGEIMGWLNSDDLLQPNSLFKIASCFQKNKEIKWIQGTPCIYNEKDEIIYERDQVSNKQYFLLKKYELDGAFIQQESTFWKRELWDKAGGFINTDYKLAGDFELWMRFFKYSKLYCVDEKLGGFRKRDGQMSDNYSVYLSEANLIINNCIRNATLFKRLVTYFFKIKIKFINIFGKKYKFTNILVKH